MAALEAEKYLAEHAIPRSSVPLDAAL
jgi:hypothetical protein